MAVTAAIARTKSVSCGGKATRLVLPVEGNRPVPTRPISFHTQDDSGNDVDPNCHTFIRGKDMARARMQRWKFPRS